MYALTSWSYFQAKHVQNVNVLKSVLKNCGTLPSIKNITMHNCKFSVNDLIETIRRKSYWNRVRITDCGVDDSEISYMCKFFSDKRIKVNLFEV